MSRDRLRDIRNQQQLRVEYENNSTTFQSNDYYPPTTQNGYSNDREEHSLMNSSHMNYSDEQGWTNSEMSRFLIEVDQIRTQIEALQSNVHSITQLHQSRLLEPTFTLSASSTERLSHLTTASNSLASSIRNSLNQINEKSKSNANKEVGEFRVRRDQIGSLQASLRKVLREWELIEMNNREKLREKIVRQIKIVNPNATNEEIKATVEEEDGGQQIFQQALIRSRQSGARAAFAEVQVRNQDLRRIEESIIHLAGMIQDLSEMVLEQDETVQGIQEKAEETNIAMQAGLGHTQTAVKSARSARKMRWICFGILILLLVVGAIIAVVVTKPWSH